MSHTEPGEGSEDWEASADTSLAISSRESSAERPRRRASVAKSGQSTRDPGERPWWALPKRGVVDTSTESPLQRHNVFAKFIRSAAETEVEPPAVLRKAKKPGFLKKLPPWQDALAGAAAGLGSTLLLHPLDVVKTRLQGADMTLHCFSSPPLTLVSM